MPSDLEYALEKHRYVSSPGGKPNINVTSIAKLMDDGKSSAFAGSAVKITKAGGDYRAEWDASGVFGTRIHGHFEKFLQGLPIQMQPDEKAHVDALEKFIVERSPKLIIDPEFVVVCEFTCPICDETHGFGGRGDVAAEIDGENWLLDLKTGKKYAVEHTLQLSGLRFGQLAVYDPSGALVESLPMPEFAHTGCLYTKEDGTYDLDEYPGDEIAYRTFQSLVHAYAWTRTPEITTLRNAWRKKAA